MLLVPFPAHADISAGGGGQRADKADTRVEEERLPPGQPCQQPAGCGAQPECRAHEECSESDHCDLPPNEQSGARCFVIMVAYVLVVLLFQWGQAVRLAIEEMV